MHTTVTGRACRYVKIGCALVFDAAAAYGLFKLTQPYFFKNHCAGPLKKMGLSLGKGTKSLQAVPLFANSVARVKRKEQDLCSSTPYQKIQALDFERYVRQWLAWVFFLKANPLVPLLFCRNIDDRFINLVRVSRKNSYSNVSKSQWVWSGVFSWKNSPWAEERCNKWHQKEPNPDTFRGIY